MQTMLLTVKLTHKKFKRKCYWEIAFQSFTSKYPSAAIHIYSSVTGLEFPNKKCGSCLGKTAGMLEVATPACVGKCVPWHITITTTFYMICNPNNTLSPYLINRQNCYWCWTTFSQLSEMKNTVFFKSIHKTLLQSLLVCQKIIVWITTADFF